MEKPQEVITSAASAHSSPVETTAAKHIPFILITYTVCHRIARTSFSFYFAQTTTERCPIRRQQQMMSALITIARLGMHRAALVIFREAFCTNEMYSQSAGKSAAVSCIVPAQVLSTLESGGCCMLACQPPSVVLLHQEKRGMSLATTCSN